MDAYKNKVWQSYEQMKTALSPLAVKSGEGVYLILETGKRMIDGVSSWWTVCHGHAHPHIINKLIEQAKQLPHIMFTDLAHRSVYEVSQKLIQILPRGLEKFLYCESGSVSIEIALKIALQYHQNHGKRKPKFIYFENGYHGDTLGCSLVTDDTTEFHRFFKRERRSLRAKIPKNKEDLLDFEKFVQRHQDEVAALIIEPIFQGGGGMKFYPASVLRDIFKISRKYGILFIADEIASGFYRTGEYFACDHAEITPDIICLGKALTGGVIPFAAVGTTNDVFYSFYSDRQEAALKHASTYAANPLGCVAAIGSIELFEQELRKEQVARISDQLNVELKPLRKINKVKDVRVLGGIGVVELNCSGSEIHLMRNLIREKDVWLRPFGNVLYTMPPFITVENEITAITKAMEELILKI